jgi:membrane protein implicated in regulation of membrane protease activity
MISTDTIRPKGIIVLKNDTGKGGNIVVQKTVKKIDSSIFAEGTLYSGESMTDLYNDTTLEVVSLSDNQLYIIG